MLNPNLLSSFLSIIKCNYIKGIRLAELSTLPRDVIIQAKALATSISMKKGVS